MIKLLKFLTAAIMSLLVIVLANTARFDSPRISVEPIEPIELDENAIAERLSNAVRLPTISYEDPEQLDRESFLAFHKFLEQSYPLSHQTLSRETINEFSLLYHWRGKRSDLKPILLMGHFDVVPATNEDRWTHGPFSGMVADGSIWGRGTLDDKFTVLGALEAIEILITENFQPERSIYLAFGHDEEVGGVNGAKLIAQHLKDQNLEFEMILDEGGTIVHKGVIPGVDSPVAMIGIAEKGYVNLKLTATDTGGHSSMPPKNTALGIVANAITNLEQNPFPPQMQYAEALFENVGPKMQPMQKAVFANMWLTRPLIEGLLSDSKSTNAVIRTTTAATMASASPKSNVLPNEAWAVVNFRIMPGESPESVKQYVTETINDERITVTQIGNANSPSPVSKADNFAFATLSQSIAQIETNRDLVISPYIVVGGTDAKHYVGLSDSIYRFTFSRFSPESLSQMHGIDEQIKVEDYLDTVRFFYQLINNFQKN